jgi:hypothetical protein
MIRMLGRHSLASAILAAAFLSFQAGGARGQEEPPVEVTPIPGTVEATPTPATAVEATPTPATAVEATPTPATAVEAAGSGIPIEAGTTPGSPISTTATQAGVPGPASAVPSGTSLRSAAYVPLTISLSVHEGFDDNFRTMQSAQGSWYTSPAVSLLYNLPGTATQVNVHSGASFTYYSGQGRGGGGGGQGQGQGNNINAYVNSTIIHEVSQRLKLEANLYAAYRTEPDISSNVGSDTKQGNFFHTLDSLAATYHWSPRFFTVTTDKFQLVDYGNSGQGSSQNRIENTIDQELKYDLLHHGNTVVGEYRFKITDYQNSSLNSFTNFALVGLDQDFSPQFRVTIRGGATIRSFTNDGSRITPQFEGSLIYAGAHNSLLSWKTSYGTEDASVGGVLSRTTFVGGVLSRTTFRTGLEFRYGVTARITATLDAYYHHDNQGVAPGSSGGNSTGGSTGSNFSEDAFDVFLDGRYAMNPRWSFDLGFEYSGINSIDAARDFTRLRYSAGLTYNF